MSQVKRKYEAVEDTVMTLDETKLQPEERDALERQKRKLEELVDAHKRQHDPALFYEQMLPERAKELA